MKEFSSFYVDMCTTYVGDERERMERLMSEKVEEWIGIEEKERLTRMLHRACTDEEVGRIAESLWKKHCLHCTQAPLHTPDKQPLATLEVFMIL